MKLIFQSFLLPFVLVLLMWASKMFEYFFQIDLGSFGILPRTLSGLKGILLTPFLHGDWQHLVSNTPALLVLGGMIRFFYPTASLKALFLILILSGAGVWLFGRFSYHIGASGLVYGLAFYLFFGSVFRKDTRSLAISLFVLLFYGSMVWGLLPLDQGVSFEAHISGALSGTCIAFIDRKKDVIHHHESEGSDSFSTDDALPTYKELKEKSNDIKRDQDISE